MNGPAATKTPAVPPALRAWFMAHFIADYVFAVPLFLAPRPFLAALGWPEIDTLSARLVAAALFAIGGMSLVGKSEGPETFRTMLRLKIVWASAGIIAILLSLYEGASPFGWAALAFFAAFGGAWTYYLRKI